jgi:uncharacterized alpha-E superfamily protein
MISRVADHCFWFGRYLDRAESTARLLQATRTLVFDADIPVTQCWQPLVIVSGQYPLFIGERGAETAVNGEQVQRYMTWDADNPVSLARSVFAARESAKVIREVLSLETWEEVNELHLWLASDDAQALYAENREQFYRRVRKATQLVLGLVRSTMLHDTPMSFLWLGVMLERCGQTARILDMHHHTMAREEASLMAMVSLEGPPSPPTMVGVGPTPAAAPHAIVEVALWLSLLKACSGQEAFLKKHQGRVSARAVMSFLLFDRQFPRSLRYCLASARKLLDDIWPGRAPDATLNGPHARMEALGAWLDRRARVFAPHEIHELLTHVVDETGLVCAGVGKEIAGPARPESPPAATSTQIQKQVQ